MTIFHNPKTEDNTMQLYDVMKLLEGKNNRFGEVPQVNFKLGSRTLSVNHRELSKDGKSVTIFLQVEQKEPANGVQPSWQIDKASQKSQMLSIKEWLEAGNTITPLDALEHFGCFRLSAQIFNLKKMGLHIECKTDKDPRTGKRYGTYWLVKEADK